MTAREVDLRVAQKAQKARAILLLVLGVIVTGVIVTPMITTVLS